VNLLTKLRGYLVPLLATAAILIAPSGAAVLARKRWRSKSRPARSEPGDLFAAPIGGRTLLGNGLLIVALGLLFGLVIYRQLKNVPVHRSMLEISELIYETCKTYLVTQIKFLVILEIFIGSIIVFYFGVLQHFAAIKVAIHFDVQRGRHLRKLRCGWFGIA